MPSVPFTTIVCWFLLMLASVAHRIEAQQRSSQAASADLAQINEIRLKLLLIGRAMLMHEQTLGRLPGHPDQVDAARGAGLSWRVHLLPFVGEPELYEEFRFDEPWDSPHNLRLATRMPDLYRLERSRDTKTRFRTFTGSEFLVGSLKSVQEAKDGKAHTILVIATAPDLAVPWTKPEAPFNSLEPASFTSGTKEPSIECVMADGQLLSLRASTDAKILTALATARGGELVDAEALRRRGPAPVSNTIRAATKATRPESTTPKKLKDVALAMQNYHDTYRCFPVVKKAEYFDEQGKPKLSWRVHLLPFLEQQPLYDRFHLDESWDSPHNRELLKFIPEVYAEEGLGTATRFITIQGEFALFGRNRVSKMADIADGTTHTMLVVQCAADKAVPWTKPDENYFDPTQPFACVGAVREKGVACVMVDGAVWVFRPSLSPELFSALVTPRGNEVINATELRAARLE